MVARHGYELETHKVITEDDYILAMHRIPRGKQSYSSEKESRPVVYIQHGLTSSSADWLVPGPDKALGITYQAYLTVVYQLTIKPFPGYVLAENGYDVWLGNYRGNLYSRKHQTLNPDSLWNNDYWQFSWVKEKAKVSMIT